MSLHAIPSSVVRFPPRLRVISSDGVAVGKPCVGKAVGAISRPKTAGGFALDALLSAGTIDDRQHAAGLAYERLRRRHRLLTADVDTVLIATCDAAGRSPKLPAGLPS